MEDGCKDRPGSVCRALTHFSKENFGEIVRGRGLSPEFVGRPEDGGVAFDDGEAVQGHCLHRSRQPIHRERCIRVLLPHVLLLCRLQRPSPREPDLGSVLVCIGFHLCIATHFGLQDEEAGAIVPPKILGVGMVKRACNKHDIEMRQSLLQNFQGAEACLFWSFSSCTRR